MKIIKNCIQCKACGEMVESKSRHAFLTCSYGGGGSVDRGLEYLWWVSETRADFTEML